MSSTEVLSDAKAAEQIESLFGADNVLWSANTIKRGIEIIKTPSPSLDRALGIGGWPRGRLIQLAGKESSGKTLLALLTCPIGFTYLKLFTKLTCKNRRRETNFTSYNRYFVNYAPTRH